jgi:carbonic anhydrase
MKTHTKDTQENTTPRMALEILKEGNNRFLKNYKENRNLLQQVNDTRDGPMAFCHHT